MSGPWFDPGVDRNDSGTVPRAVEAGAPPDFMILGATGAVLSEPPYFPIDSGVTFRRYSGIKVFATRPSGGAGGISAHGTIPIHTLPDA